MNHSSQDPFDDIYEQFIDRINMIPLSREQRHSPQLDEALLVNQMLVNRIHHLRTHLEINDFTHQAERSRSHPLFDNFGAFSLLETFFSNTLFPDTILSSGHSSGWNWTEQQPLEDVKVILSGEEFEKLPLRYTNDTDCEGDCACNICMENYQLNEKLVVLPCKHEFHQECARHWLTQEKVTCPVCRKDTRTTIANKNSN
jgi:Ring finger domain